MFAVSGKRQFAIAVKAVEAAVRKWRAFQLLLFIHTT